VYDVCAEQQRDVQPALIHCQMLIGIGALGANGVEHRADAARGSKLHHIQVIGGHGVYGNDHGGFACRRLRSRCRGVTGVVVLDELPDFFFERHLPEQTLNADINGWAGQLGVRCMARLVRG